MESWTPYDAGEAACETCRDDPEVVGAGTTLDASPFAPASASPSPTLRPPGDGATPQGASVSGISSWYRYVPGGAAAGPALRRALGPGWRGTRVTVCTSRCIRVVLSDWCQCDTSGEKLIDLDSRSFAQLAPLSRGIVRVTVTKVGG